MMTILKTADRYFGAFLRWFCIIDMLALTAVMGAVVFIRFVPIAKLSWSDEIIQWLTAALIFIAAAELWRENDHFKIDALAQLLAGTRFGRLFTLFLEILAGAFIILFAYYSLNLTVGEQRTSPILAWPMMWWYAPMPISGFIMVIYWIRNIVQGTRDVIEGFRRDTADGSRTP